MDMQWCSPEGSFLVPFGIMGHAPWRMVLSPLGAQLGMLHEGWCSSAQLDGSAQKVPACSPIAHDTVYLGTGVLFHTVCLLWVVTALIFIPFVSEDTILSSVVRITLLSSILFFPSVSGWLQLPAQINKVSLESLGGISLNPRRERKPQSF